MAVTAIRSFLYYIHEENKGGEIFMEALIDSYLLSFPLFVLMIIIAVMLYTLSKGADILVDEAVSLSLHLGIPKMIIGATIVSLGTTLPEASVSVLAAVNGNPDLALGNAIGSVIADTGLIIGIAAVIGSLPVNQTIVKRQGKIQVWSGILLALVSLPLFSNGNGNISQAVGWLFIFLLILYIYTSIKWTRASSINETAVTSISDEVQKINRNNNNKISTSNKLDSSSKVDISTINIVNDQKDSTVTSSIEEKNPLSMQILKLIAGIILVLGSSKLLIPAVDIAAVRIGIPQSIIAATLVAFGTSLPELITAVTAVRKGHGELAIGNIVGADILNVLFVIGGAASVTAGGLNVPVNFYKLQIPTMLIILITFRFFSKGKNEEITTKEGLVLLTIYIIYLVLNYI